MRRDFSLGSEWLYFKIYCGVKTADFILLDYLKEAIKELIADKYISKWFFIRYHDPEAHLRLRFKIDHEKHLGTVITKLYRIFDILQTENLIWKIQTDTYSRELERYGVTTYELSEFIFQADSELILDYIDLKPNFEKETTTILFSFLAIDQFLTLFGLTNTEKLEVLHRLQESFKQEFQADKTLKKQLDKHYRDLENQISSFLAMEDLAHQSLYHIIQTKTEKIKASVLTIKTLLDTALLPFLSSHIHMILNRQFTSRQREYELLIYDHLYRYYKKRSYIFNK
ncbi:thiopeptide-type bacteriocin biosynthesis protein [Flavobacterium sp. J27]|uniref:thiopeptide-type bacteriocin biosynthesis protein n=1 Tax=Flavobacterium sp. J27 TaxID=2060419 RepID=UPI00103223CD|nr:thiopeptide-type bacteriocin biosynthesis protein [Flavobacterium sp. J27]